MDVRATFGESGLNSGRINTLWAAGPILCITFVQNLIAFYSRPEASSNVVSGRFVGPVVPKKHVKFGDPRLNLSREIPPQAV